MGCDYYTWIETIIVYKDLSGTLQYFVERGMMEKHYEDLSHIDTDFKLPPSPKQIIDEDIRIYGKKFLYTAGLWICHYNGKMRIYELCETNNIPINSLVEVYKKKNGRER